MKMKDKRALDAKARAAHREQLKAAKERHRASPKLERPKPVKEERQRILVYCEGKNTEPSYFSQFRLANIDVKCFGEGRNTVSLVKHAILLRR